MKIKQGKVTINPGYCVGSGEYKVLYIDMKTKRGNISTYIGSGKDGPGLIIEPSEDSVFVSDSQEDTEISFKEYVGWRIIATDVSRYTLTIVLEKEP